MGFIGFPGPMELIILAAFGMLALGGLVVLALLLGNEKTRMAGVVLLIVVLLMGVAIASAGAFLFWQVRSAPIYTQPIQRPPTIEYKQLPADPDQTSEENQPTEENAGTRGLSPSNTSR